MNPKMLRNLTAEAILAAFATLVPIGLPASARAQLDAPDLVIGPDGIPEGYILVEGDMLVPIGTTAAAYQVNLWPQGNPTVIPFMFDTTSSNCNCLNFPPPCSAPCVQCSPTTCGTSACDAVSAPNQISMRNAMAQWEAVADIDFRQCPNNQCSGNFILIRDSSNDCNPGNNSMVGMVGGQQIINITTWNKQFTIAHELGHALGVIHEQTRADRGNFVTINSSNIQTGFGGQFAIRSAGGEYGPYDFDSNQHYGVCDFSICCPPGATCNCPANCQTITILEPYATNCVDSNLVYCPRTTVGQGAYLSVWDRLVMSFIYPEDDWRFLDDRCGDRGVDCSPFIFGCVIQSGTFFCPWVVALPDAVDQTPERGTLWILSDGTSYATGGTLSKPMTIRAPLGATLTR